MKGPTPNLTGQRFGMLIVERRVENSRQGAAQWLCHCDCGRSSTVTTSRLLRGQKGCGPCRNVGKTPPPTRPASERFWEKVDKAGPIPEHRPELGRCWEWIRTRRPSGYGRFGVRAHLLMDAHRFSWILHYGSIPDGLEVCHRCDNPPCCNPSHLFLGTQSDNIRDMAAKGRFLRADGRAWGSRLTKEQVIAARRMVADGMRQRDVAAAFGVGQMTISRLCRGESWGWLKDGLEEQSA